MPSILASNAIPMTQLSIAAASITSSYVSVGTFSSWAEMLFITSTLDAAVQLSFDGVSDHLAIPAGSTVPVFIPLDFKCNNMTLPTPAIAVKRIGTPTTGNLYISGFSAAIQ